MSAPDNSQPGMVRGTDRSVSGEDSVSREMRDHFKRAKWLNLIGQSAASLLAVALCWPLADHQGLLLYLALHQGTLLAVIAAFASPLGKVWLDRSPMPRMTAPALAMSQTVGGSVLWFDLHAASGLTFALAAFAVTYATTAFTVVTLGPLRMLTRTLLVASLLPSTVAALYSGHYLLSYSSVAFIAVVGIFGVEQIHQRYSHLLRLTSRSAQDARAAHEMARRDSLTGLLNRVGVADQFKRHREEIRAAFFIDLDRFKKVNDEAGHLAGDELLRQVAVRLNRIAPAGTTVSRVGGDEFLLLLASGNLGDLKSLAAETVRQLEESFVLPAGTYSISASIGISLIEPDMTLDRVFHEADNAMYRAKRSGRGRVMVFTDDMDAELKARTDLEKELVWLVDRGEFPIYGQPIYELATGRIHAVEVLARPRFRDGSRHLPATVLPVLEELQLLDVMTGIVLQQALRARSIWRSVDAMKDTAVSINISAHCLVSDWLVHEVRNLIDEYELAPGDVIFEVTEKVLEPDLQVSEQTLLALRELGVQIVLDDFGTGYSMLNQLLTLPLSAVKIDGSVMQQVDQVKNGERIVQAIAHLAGSLGDAVIAEGVETQAQLDAVCGAGIPLAQGYLLCRPKPLDVLVATAPVRASVALPPRAASARALRVKRSAITDAGQFESGDHQSTVS